MPLFERPDDSKVTVCGVNISFDAVLLPNQLPTWQLFYDSKIDSGNFIDTNSRNGGISFVEESQKSTAVTSYRQKITFRLLVSNPDKSIAIDLLHKTRAVKLILSNGKELIIGRNDFYQNTTPSVKTKNDHNICEVEIETQSIFSTGFNQL